MFTVSINPTYLCNFSCDFCYLTPDQLRDKTRLPLELLNSKLVEISKHQEITHIDLYGGEVTVLPKDYIDPMLDVIRDYYLGDINVITNLSRSLDRTSWILRDGIDISVSWDYTCRESWQNVLKNMLMLDKDIHVLMLASECMINWEDVDILTAQMVLNSVQNVRSVEIKPYSTNQANQDYVTFMQFEEFIKRWLMLGEDFDYEFINQKLMRDALIGKRNAWSDDHIYITPTGRFAVLEFDVNDNEFFLELDTFDEYLKWVYKEREKVNKNEICSECPYLGNCLSEHLRNVRTIDNSCNGFRFLLDWYEKEAGI